MSQEILYTSAPQGLRPGSRGFCTVVSSSGMTKNLADELEQLSGYRHAFPLHDPNTRLNPVNYSHLLLTIAGSRYHVLSRICDAGLDYSRRSNKLAHHVALSENELTRGGPACVLLADGFCETEWNGQVKTIPHGRQARDAEDWGNRGLKCTRWAQVCGDAGWAGVLAESALETNGKPVSVIYRPGQEMLPLVAEALALLPPEQRWEVTYSTYFTGIPAGVDCRWRFLLEGSLEAKAARRDPHRPVIDLCSTRGKAQGGPLVETAQTGKAPLSVPDEPVGSGRMLAADGEAPLRQAPTIEIVHLTPSTPLRTPGDSLPAIGEPDHSPMPVGPHRPSPQFRRSSSRRLNQIVAGICVGALFLAFGAAMFILGTRYGAPKSVAQTPPPPTVGKQNSPDVPPDPVPVRDTKPVVANERQTVSPNPAPSESEPFASRPTDAEPSERDGQPSTEASEPDVTPASEESFLAEVKHPLEDIHARDYILPLPPINKGKVELAKVFVDDPAECELHLWGIDTMFSAAKESRFEVEDPPDGSRVWTLLVTLASAFSESQARVAEFRLANQILSFEWNPKFKSEKVKAPNLKFCPLEITARGETAQCRLIKPNEADPLKLDVFEEATFLPISIPSFAKNRSDKLYVDLQLSGFPDGRDVKGTTNFAIGRVYTRRIHPMVPPENGKEDGKGPATRQDGSEWPKALNPKHVLDINVALKAKGSDLKLVAWALSRYDTSKPKPITKEIVDSERDKWVKEAEECEEPMEKNVGQLNSAQSKLALLEEEYKDIEEQYKTRVEVEKPESAKPTLLQGSTEQERADYEKRYLAWNEKQSAYEAARRVFMNSGDGRRFIRLVDKDLPAAREKRNKFQQEFDSLQNQQDDALRLANVCKELGKLLDALHNKATIDYRVYLDVDGHAVDLVHSKGMLTAMEP